MSQNDGSSPADVAKGVALFFCFVSLGLAYLVMRMVAAAFQTWWLEAMVCILVPIAAAFVSLYLSRWHRELSRVTRSLWVLGESCVLFAAALLIAVIVAVSACVFLYRFTAFHY
jgi:hypothetical protein